MIHIKMEISKEYSNNNLEINKEDVNSFSFPTTIKNINKLYNILWEEECLKILEQKSIIQQWIDLIWNDRNWTNIDKTNQNIKYENIPNWKYFTKELFINVFNKKNQERIDYNNKVSNSFNFYEQIQNKEKLGKIWWKLYFDEQEITDIFTLLPIETIYEQIKDKSQFISLNEFKLNITHDTIKKWTNDLINNIEDENLKFHDSGLTFFTNNELLDDESILTNFNKTISPKKTIDELKDLNNDLPKIRELLKDNEEDNPDTKYEKWRLRHLINNWLFRWFQIAINTLNNFGVNCCNSSPYLKNDIAYNWLVKHLQQYQKEKNENYFKIIENINNINVNFNIIEKGSPIYPFLTQTWKKDNILYVVSLAKSFFIQRIKDWQTTNTNIETYKNQLAYMLATMQLESAYNYAAENKAGWYGWYGQIKFWYTDLRTLFAQWSWIKFKDKSWNDLQLQDIKFTRNSFIDKEYSTFAFVYWMIYWHLSNGWNLDKYINDNNINNPDFLWARKIEAWANNPKYINLTNIWKNYLNMW